MRRKSLDSLGREWYIAGTVATTTYIYLNPETLDQQLQTEFEWLVFQSSQSEWSSCLTFAAVATTNTSSASVCVQLILTIVDCQLRHVASCCGVQCSEMPARNSNVVPGSCHFLEHLSFCIVTKIPSSPSVHRHSRRWDMASSTKLHRMNKWFGPMAILKTWNFKGLRLLARSPLTSLKTGIFSANTQHCKKTSQTKTPLKSSQRQESTIFFHIGQRANNPGITSRRTRNPGGSTWTAESCCWRLVGKDSHATSTTSWHLTVLTQIAFASKIDRFLGNGKFHFQMAAKWQETGITHFHCPRWKQLPSEVAYGSSFACCDVPEDNDAKVRWEVV